MVVELIGLDMTKQAHVCIGTLTLINQSLKPEIFGSLGQVVAGQASRRDICFVLKIDFGPSELKAHAHADTREEEDGPLPSAKKLRQD